jgi:Fe-S-cluster containining protein
MKYQIYRRGECKRCGRCCDKSLSQRKYWEAAQRTDDPNVRTFITTDGGRYTGPRICNSLGRNTHCAIYNDRPPICKVFPRGPEDLVHIKDCGYWFEVRCVE